MTNKNVKDKITHVSEFDLPRSLWYRGKGDLYSALLVDSSDEQKDIGKMCCLGIYLKACGVPDKYLSGVGEPILSSDVQGDIPSWLNQNQKYPPRLVVSKDVSRLMLINDEYEDEDPKASREAKIVKIFAENGIKVNIVD